MRPLSSCEPDASDAGGRASAVDDLARTQRYSIQLNDVALLRRAPKLLCQHLLESRGTIAFERDAVHGGELLYRGAAAKIQRFRWKGFPRSTEYLVDDRARVTSEDDEDVVAGQDLSRAARRNERILTRDHGHHGVVGERQLVQVPSRRMRLFGDRILHDVGIDVEERRDLERHGWRRLGR